MSLCPSCPARTQADTLEALAEAAERTMLFRPFAATLRRRAREILEAGCGWLWNTEWKDDNTGQVVTREQCGRAALPAWLEHFAKENTLTAQAIQAERNEQHAALQEVDRIAAEIGAGETIANLAKLGTRAYLGRKIVEATEERRAIEGSAE